MAATTALLKSASSTREQLSAYQDQVKAFEYSNSAYTDEAYNAYADYLKGRINTLQAAGSISNASKALTLTKSLDSAGKSNISATIQRENIQMLSGNASLTDKYNVVVQQYTRAYANGDLTLAQSLMSQAYSINQSIQYQAQQAQDARATLAKAAASSAATAGKAEASKENDIAGSLGDSLKQLNNDIQSTGMGSANKAIAKWVSANKDVLQSLGVKLPNQPSYFDVVQGIAGAQYNHYMLSSQLYAPYGTGIGSTSWDQAKKAYNLNSNISKLPTLAGDLTLQQVMQAQADPNRYVYSPGEGKFIETQKLGNVQKFTQLFDQNGKPIQDATPGAPTLTPTFSGSVQHTVVLTPEMTTQMNKLHLQFSQNKDGTTGDGVRVQATNQTPQWLKDVIGQGGVTQVYRSKAGDGQSNDSLTFTADSKDGNGMSVYHIVQDNNGHMGIYFQGQQSEGFLKGEYGFNASMINNTHQQNQSLMGRFGNALKNGIMHPASMFGFNASDLINQATNHFTLPPPPPLPFAQPAPLPTISLPPPQAPAQSVRPAPNVANSQPIVPHTVSIQGGSPNIQGGGFNQQQGGKGITIKGTTNGPVGMRF